MTLVKQKLSIQCLDAVKEFMISRLSHLKALCTTSVSGGVRDGESACVCLV